MVVFHVPHETCQVSSSLHAAGHLGLSISALSPLELQRHTPFLLGICVFLRLVTLGSNSGFFGHLSLLDF